MLCRAPLVRLCEQHERATPEEKQHDTEVAPTPCCAYVRSDTSTDTHVGRGGWPEGRRAPRAGLGGRALPPPRRGRRPRCSRPARPAAPRSTRRSPRSRPAARRPRPAGRSASASCSGSSASSPRSRPRPPPGTELRRHQIDALAGMLTELIAANQRTPRTRRTATGTPTPSSSPRTTRTRTRSPRTTPDDDEDDEPEGFVGEDPGAVRRYRFRHPTASGKTIAAAGFVEAARTLGILILTHRRLLVAQFQRDLTTEGYGDRFTDFIERGQGAAARRSDHDPDLRLVRAPRRLALARGVPARDLRRGAHGARREDERGDPQLPGADLHRHDRDRAADREAGLGRLPRLGRRPAARGRRPARPDRAAALPARPAGRGDQLGADRRRRLRGARPRGRARPRGPEPGRREPLPRALRHDARDRLRGRRRPRLQPRAGVPRRRAEGGGGLAAARRPSSWPRRSPRTSAARSTS